MIMLRNTALAVFLTLATTAPLALGASNPDADRKTACHDYSDLNIDVSPHQCNQRYIIEHFLIPAYVEKNEAREAATGTRCEGGVWNDIMALTGTTERDDAQKKINAFCAARRGRSRHLRGAVPRFPVALL